MAKGGARPGAGRKKGVPNKLTQERQREVAASGETPLDYMLRVMRDPKQEHERRDRMAAAAAPYVHPKLANIEHTGKDGGPIETASVGELELARRIGFALEHAARKAVGNG